MNYKFDEYLNTVRRNIENKKLHVPICTELESHLQDSADFYVEIGYDEETANAKALENMGEPKKVARALSALHDVSDIYKILIGVYIFVTVIKILDSALASYVSSPWLISLNLNDVYPFFAEFFYMILLLVSGIALSLKTSRYSPAVFAAILTVVDWGSVEVFNLITLITVRGKLDELIHCLRDWEYIPEITNSEYLTTYFMTGLFFALVAALFIGTFIKVSKPMSSGYRIKTFFAISSAVLLCVAGVSVIGVNVSIDSKDKAQYEEYSQTVSDTVDLLKEMKTINADDTDKVLKYFDYLEFEKSRDDKQKFDSYRAVISEPVLTVSELYFDVHDDGTVTLQFNVDQRAIATAVSPLIFFHLMLEDSGVGRWEQSIASNPIESYANSSMEGDSLEAMFDIIKLYNCSFSYSNESGSAYDKYAFNFEIYDFLTNNKYCEIYTDDGLFVFSETEQN